MKLLLNNDHLHFIQGLRAIAIISVLLFHFFPEVFPNGYLGVDVFFVISGFLITQMLCKIEKYTVKSFLNFYERRLKRILPMYLIYLITAVCLYTYFATPVRAIQEGQAALHSLSFTYNIFSLLQKEDYFKRIHNDSLFTHTWSLSVEVQFYLIMPVIHIACLSVQRRYPLVRLSHIFVGLMMISALLFVQVPSSVSFNVMPARLWQFLSGALAAESTLAKGRSMKNENEEAKGALRFASSAAPMNLLLSSFLFALLLITILPVFVHPVLSRIIITAVTAFLCIYGNQNYLLSFTPITHIGDISYVLYLFHWPLVIYFVPYTEATSITRLCLIPVSLVISSGIHTFLENPLRHLATDRLFLSLLLIYPLTVFCIFYSPMVNARIFSGRLARHPFAASIVENEEAFRTAWHNFAPRGCVYEHWHNMTEPKHLEHITKPFGLCRMPEGTGRLHIAVIGNSYAVNQLELIYKHFSRFAKNFTMFAQIECEVLAYTHSKHCKHFYEYADALQELKPDVTFIVQRYFASLQVAVPRSSFDPTAEELISYLKKLLPHSSLFFIEDAIPSFNTNAFSLLNDMLFRQMPADKINERLVNDDGVSRARTRILKMANHCQDKCRLFDISPAFSDQDNNFVVLDANTSLAMFEPTMHLTPYGKAKADLVFARLSAQYEQQIIALANKLYP